MAEVFISYSSQHRALTERLAAVIEAARGPGSVWYDKEISSGEQFRPEITAALDAARAVVVVWTAGAVESTWVYAEAVRAAAARKIVTVREASLAPERIPLPFNVYHTDTIDDASEGHAALIAAIARRIEGKEAAPLPADLPGAGFRGFLLDPRQEALPARATARRPASLLVARHRLVEYDDIHAIRQEMVAWATTTPAHAMGSPVLARLVHGPGGLGKTRALIEVAETLTREHGWLAGFVPRGVREEARTAMESLIARGGGATGLLLVLDYAEGRQEDATWLAERLVKRAETVAAPARLVMLSRGAGDWWGELVRKSQALQELTSLGGDLYDVRAIPEEIGRGDRIALFDRAVEAFVALRTAHEQTAPDLPPVSDA
ncbi:MAG: toll/interleukin-1 receptor domain-containing protein, partial [Hyphomicrobiaceae bacterium]